MHSLVLRVPTRIPVVHLNRFYTLVFVGTTCGTLSVSDRPKSYPMLLKVPRKFLISIGFGLAKVLIAMS
jgi:hypothetical protein